MTVTLDYDDTLGRVIINANGLGAAVSATVERSVDLVRWTVVRGGDTMPVAGGLIAPLNDYEFIPNVLNTYRVVPDTGITQTDSITPVLTETWVKSVSRPFLNMSFAQSEITSDITRNGRQGIFNVIGRVLPVAVTDLHQSREYTLRLVTESKALAGNLDLLTSLGDILFVHAPPTWPLPPAYMVAQTAQQQLRIPTEFAVWSLAMREVAAPGPNVVGTTSTYQTVLNTYATYNDLLLAHDDYASVLTLIGSFDEVVVP